MRLTQKINAFRHTSLVQSERLRGELPDLSVVVYGLIQKGGGGSDVKKWTFAGVLISWEARLEASGPAKPCRDTTLGGGRGGCQAHPPFGYHRCAFQNHC